MLGYSGMLPIASHSNLILLLVLSKPCRLAGKLLLCVGMDVQFEEPIFSYMAENGRVGKILSLSKPSMTIAFHNTEDMCMQNAVYALN